nr:MAPEG family protein [Gluconobacter albidus]
MPLGLVWLGWTLVLAFVQLFLTAAACRQQDGLQWASSNRDGEPPRYTGMAARLKRAQANLAETLPIFIGAVLGLGPLQPADGLGGRDLFSDAGDLYPGLCLGMGCDPQSDLGHFNGWFDACADQSVVKEASVRDGGGLPSRIIHRSMRAEMTRQVALTLARTIIRPCVSGISRRRTPSMTRMMA